MIHRDVGEIRFTSNSFGGDGMFCHGCRKKLKPGDNVVLLFIKPLPTTSSVFTCLSSGAKAYI